FWWQIEYPLCILEVKSKKFSAVLKKNWEKSQKSDGKWEFLRKTCNFR
ncbi:hypothetical protein FWK35_00026547, partial [Aphis craccivora]